MSRTGSLLFVLLTSSILFAKLNKPERKVENLNKRQSTKKSEGTTIYLTVDDGPYYGTDNILTITELEKVPVALFLVGRHMHEKYENSEELLKRIQKSSYITLGNHSYSHAHGHYKLFYSNPADVVEDMKKANIVFGFNEQPIYARLPGRNVYRLPKFSCGDKFLSKEQNRAERKAFDEVFKAGFYLYGWDHEWDHYKSGKPIQSVQTLMDQIKKIVDADNTVVKGHLILLTHDVMFRDEFNGKENFKNFIIALKEAGYKLGRIENYPYHKITIAESENKSSVKIK